MKLSWATVSPAPLCYQRCLRKWTRVNHSQRQSMSNSYLTLCVGLRFQVKFSGMFLCPPAVEMLEQIWRHRSIIACHLAKFAKGVAPSRPWNVDSFELVPIPVHVTNEYRRLEVKAGPDRSNLILPLRSEIWQRKRKWMNELASQALSPGVGFHFNPRQ